MGLLQKKKKVDLSGRPVPGQIAKAGGETSSLRPRYVDKIPPCMEGCPGGTRVREVLAVIARTERKGRTWDESYEQAFHIIMETNPFPAVCGRVCPHPCEDRCNRARKDGAVAVNSVERFIGDHAIAKGLRPRLLTDERRAGRIAVIGSGPAGLSCAYQLCRRGYGVTVLEALPKAGGMLRYGIPAYRLPRDVLDAEIRRIADMGVEIRTSTMVGKDLAYESLASGYSAVFVGIGAHKGRDLGIPGEDAENVWTGVEFLGAASSGRPADVGDRVLVVGGGDTAVDAARISRRLGASRVTILYRRTREEMPAIAGEIDEAIAEGIELALLAAPVEVLREGNRAAGLRCIRMELGEPDESGRRRPVPVEGSGFVLDASAIIAAISQEPDLAGLGQFRSGGEWIQVDAGWCTPVEKAWAGGDAIELGLASVAISQGRLAAEAIDRHLRGAGPPPAEARPVITHERMLLDWYEDAPRHESRRLAADERLGALDIEVASTLPENEARAEAARCMSCGACMECENCWKYCQDNAVIRPASAGEAFAFKLEFCQGCKKCAENCPSGHVDMI